MVPFSTKKATARYGVVIDIGSSSVGIGVVAAHPHTQLPDILFTHRELLRTTHEDTRTRQQRMRELREALFAALLVCNDRGLAALHAHNADAHIDTVLVTCSSPWSHTISRSISYDNEERGRITSPLISDLIASAENEIANTLEESAIIGKLGLSVIERTTVDVRVNGYPVKDPVGLQGTTIELSHVTGLVPDDILATITDMHEKTFPTASISIHTYMLTAYCVMRELFPEAASFCIIDITNESTEVGIVEDGVLRETSYTPHGSHTLVTTVQENIQGTYESTVSLLHAYAEGTLAQENRDAIAASLETYTKEVGAVFDSLQKSHHIPLSCVVTADRPLEALFCTLLPTIMENRSNGTYTAVGLQKLLHAEQLQDDTSDIFITLGSRFFHKLHGCGDLELT